MAQTARTLRIIGTPEDLPLSDHTRDRLLTVDEAAAKLNIGRTLCYAMVKAGHLKVVRFPGSRLVRVSESAIQAFVRGEFAS